jgi:hypothetical protein
LNGGFRESETGEFWKILNVRFGPFVSIDSKGEVRTFAALRSKVCNTGQSELSLRLRQWPLTELDHWAMLP